MGTVRSMDRRHEPRTAADLDVTVWGVDTRGDRFLQRARASEISLGGALLSGLDVELRSGDVLGVLYAGRKARYRVVWVRYGNTDTKIRVAVHRIEPDTCPWQEFLAENPVATAEPVNIP